MTSILPALRQAAPRLTRQLFQSPHRCPGNVGLRVTHGKRSRASFSNVRNFGASAPKASIATGHAFGPESQAVSSLSSLSESIKARVNPAKGAFFPETTQKSVAYWLLGSAASVFGIVVFGGLTRLTESGFVPFSPLLDWLLTRPRLSITEWRPVTGSLPPFNEEDWDAEFSKYRSSPEFKLLNPNMTMSEFKKIYYMEWTHRLWGRFVGLSFAVPAIYFIARRRVSKSMALRITGIGGLIGFQGVLGWWMVKSGLKDDLFAPGSHPRVSQYRLVAHLGTAFLCYSAMLWNGLQILRERKLLSNLESAQTILARLRNPRLRIFRASIGALAVLVFTTAMSGGFVAGLDAGLIYNDFPWMGASWTPPKAELLSDFYSQKADGRDLWWRNMFENPSLAQLDHRVLATTTFGAVVALFVYARYSPKAKRLIPIGSRKAMHGVLGFACLQVALGISTLIYLVPLPLASAHQAGSLALLSYVLILASRTWLPNPRLSALLAKRMVAAGPPAAKKAIRSPNLYPKSNVWKAMPELQKKKPETQKKGIKSFIPWISMVK
ncbi:MAG: hypothetical protein Q9217_006037 [Psora testacea]